MTNNSGMKQQDLGLNLSTRRTGKEVLLDEMGRVMPWAELVAVIAAHMPVAKTGRPAFALEMMLRIHCLRQWFGAVRLRCRRGFVRDDDLPRLRGLERRRQNP